MGLGNSSYVTPIKPMLGPSPLNQIQNAFGLSPRETDHLNAFFHQYSGSDRRLSFKQFKKLYSDLNPSVPEDLLHDRALFAFFQVDSNRDGQISFDEFVDAYANNVVTKSYFACCAMAY